MNDYVLIVDQYRRHALAQQFRRKLDPAHEAAAWRVNAKMLGVQGRMHAIVNEDDNEGISCYHRAGFEVHSMNGDRETALIDFLTAMSQELTHDPPAALTVATDDPQFGFLLRTVADKQKTRIALWVLGNYIHGGLRAPHFNARPLEELLPETKVPRIDVRLDYENLHLGLIERGWNGSIRSFVQAVRDAFEPVGEVVRVVAYADYGLLKGEGKRDWQRELLEAGVEATYLVNERGKNTADMKIADAVRDLLEGHSSAGDAIDVIGLGTNDRDFKTVIETARQRGKQLKLLAIRGGLSRHLANTVPEKDVIYIDDFLTLGPTTMEKRAAPTDGVTPSDSDTAIVVRIAAWLARQGERGWRFAPTATLIEALALNEHDLAQVEKAVAASKLRRGSYNGPNGREETLGLQTEHPVVHAIRHLVRWAPDRVGYCLDAKGMPYVDSNYLAKGMQMDRTLVELSAGQTRQEAETWLRLLADAGVLVRKEQERPGTPGKPITTWWLPPVMQAAAETDLPQATEPQAASPAEPSPDGPPAATVVEPATVPDPPQEKKPWDPFRLRGTVALAGWSGFPALTGATGD